MNKSETRETAKTSGDAENGEKEVVDPLSRNIHNIADLRARFEYQASRHQIVVERVTLWLGRPTFLYTVLAVVLCWIVGNLLARTSGLRPLDPPPFSWLQGTVSLFALLMTIVVLITQNRQGWLAQQRDELDLQINLITEQRTAKIIGLLEELRRDMPLVPSRVDAEAEALTETVDPHIVLTALEYKTDQALATMNEKKLSFADAQAHGDGPGSQSPNPKADFGDDNRIVAGGQPDGGPDKT